MNVNFFELNYGPEEQAAVADVLSSKWISMGEKARVFEQRFAEFIGCPYAVALNSCTAALHLAMRLLEIGPGDDVIVPSLTFVATVNAVLYTGATPVFADIRSLDDWTISPGDIEKKITPRTKAIVVMHYGGFGCDMEAILGIARGKKIHIVEDACHAPGGMRAGKKLGTLGDISCYSFYSNKNMATAEGGMLLTGKKEYAERARQLRSHGMTTSAYEREHGAEFYDVTECGYNYRLDDIRAALGLAQLEKLPADIEKRNRWAKRYRELLAPLAGVHMPFSGYGGLSTYYIFSILLHTGARKKVRAFLSSRGVQTSMCYPPAHLFSHCQKHSVHLPVTEAVGSRALTLPMHGNLTEDQIAHVCRCLKESLEESGANHDENS